ncbi:MAG TPA: PGRS family protein [Polyangiaceae bacterium]|nr:PGRS family protein [Polyangiaceae bacterium]
MRRMVRTLAGLGFLILAVSAPAACFRYEDDPLRCYECRGEPTGGGGGGGPNVPPPGCIPSATSPGGSVSDDCGVFASATGSDSNQGTKDAPVATLAKAIAIAEKSSRRVYACAEDLQGGATVPAGFVIFGGLDCSSGWAYAGGSKPTRLVGAADQPALVLASGPEKTRLEDVHVVAGDAAAPGGSSIAVIAEGGEVELARCTLEAGSAMAGADGQAFGEAAAPGVDGNPGGDACSAGTVLPGDAVVNDCGGGTESIGGTGGIGSAAAPSDGSTGLPESVDNGGAAEKVGSACTDGLAGDAGMDGAPGAGGTGSGAIDSAGYTGVLGAPGMPGALGQGGGGGGGSKGGVGAGKCLDSTKAGGASGGSGASGGCGGAGGKPGGAGGSSVALISLNAKLTFTGVSLIAKNGGDGGAGGPGQDGGPGGASGGPGGGVPAGVSLKPGCTGGPGGNGGRGGPGGNGSGGHSLGIAFTGPEPAIDGAMITVGQAGSGGMPADPMGAGAEGEAAPTLGFP